MKTGIRIRVLLVRLGLDGHDFGKNNPKHGADIRGLKLKNLQGGSK